MTQAELVVEQSRQEKNRVRVGLFVLAAVVVVSFVFPAKSLLPPRTGSALVAIALICFIYPVGVMYEAWTAPKCLECHRRLTFLFCAVAVATQRCGRCGKKITEDTK